MSEATPPAGAAPGRVRWALLLAGQFLLVFAVVALSGPGRIDIVDGQTRYEVARSLVDHGDVRVRDPRIWFMVFPGRDGHSYSSYKLPQSVLGVGAIAVADATGPVAEPRRHFFFSLTGAFAAAWLSLMFTVWFRARGYAPAVAVGWGCLGVFCTPVWFYGTSTFDDVLGSAAAVSAMVVAYLGRQRHPHAAALASGLLMGVAFHCKEPLGIFVLAAAAMSLAPAVSWRDQWGRVALVATGVAMGLVTYQLYELYKFPPGTTGRHDELMKQYVPFWTANPLPAVAGLALSPGAGALWYCPPLLLGVVGLARLRKTEPRLVAAILAGAGVFVAFLCCLTFFTGDPSWGPRYLTPVYAVLWLFAPVGGAAMAPLLLRALLVLGVLVQLLALSVDQHRLYIARNLPSAFYYHYSPWLYFDRDVAHLLNRPREITELLQSTAENEIAFTPGPEPTFAFPVIDYIDRADPAMKTSAAGLGASPLVGPLVAPGALATREPLEKDRPAAVRRYHVLNSFRPWWASQGYLPAAARPVDLVSTAALLLALASAGALGIRIGLRNSREPAGVPAALSTPVPVDLPGP
jgi:hypothetical protein